MQQARLSSNGRIVIPKAVRDAHGWQPGQEFLVIDTDNGVLLRAARPFAPTKLEDVAGCLQFEDSPRSLEEMERAIGIGVKVQRDNDS